MNENNRIIKNQAGVIYTLDSRQLLTKMSFFEIPKKSADIGHEFHVLTKTKHVGHNRDVLVLAICTQRGQFLLMVLFLLNPPIVILPIEI